MDILEERRKKMGIPTRAGSISQVPVSAPNKFKALADLKRGAKRSEFGQFIKAENSSVASQSGFQIPEVKQQKNPNQPKSKNAVAPVVMPVKESAEARSLEEMMLGGSGGVSVSTTPNGTISDIQGPTFDPQSVLEQKNAEAVKNGGYSQYSQASQNSNSEMNQLMEMMETMMQQKSTPNIAEIKPIMESIAKRVAENTMKTVINEFLEKSKKQNLYEVYSKQQNIVKIKGKLYKLTPVKLKS